MRYNTFTSPVSGFVKYPNNVAFMYSRQPVIVECETTSALKVEAMVTCATNGGKSHTEVRYLRHGYAEFDLSRIFQALARDVDSILQRVDYTTPRSLAEVFSLEVKLAGTIILSLTNEIQGMYGALDATEVYGGISRIRHFINYPQTVNVWKDSLGVFSVKYGGETLSPVYNADDLGRCREVSLQSIFGSDIIAGDLKTSWLYRIQEGEQSAQAERIIEIVPDVAPLGHGAYLRWLNRRGEVSYFHFDKTELETSAGVSESFNRFLSGDTSAPENGTFRNPEKRNYTEARQLGLVARNLSEEEFDTLVSLLSSPVVEMLYVSEAYQSLGLRFDGGTATSTGYEASVSADAEGGNTVDGGKADATLYTPEELRWVRVNVDGGSQARSLKRKTPRLHDFQVTITLIERNTAKI